MTEVLKSELDEYFFFAAGTYSANECYDKTLTLWRDKYSLINFPTTNLPIKLITLPDTTQYIEIDDS